MSIHLGKLVRQVAKEKGVKFTWLAQELHMSRQNLNSIFQRRFVDVELLQKLSVALDYNFFMDVTPDKFKTQLTNAAEDAPAYKQASPRISIQIHVDDPEMERKILETALSEEVRKSLGLQK